MEFDNNSSAKNIVCTVVFCKEFLLIFLLSHELNSTIFKGIIVAFFTYGNLFYTLVTLMPKYLNNVHGYDTKLSGFLSTLPHLLRWIGTVLQAPLVAW